VSCVGPEDLCNYATFCIIWQFQISHNFAYIFSVLSALRITNGEISWVGGWLFLQAISHDWEGLRMSNLAQRWRLVQGWCTHLRFSKKFFNCGRIKITAKSRPKMGVASIMAETKNSAKHWGCYGGSHFTCHYNAKELHNLSLHYKKSKLVENTTISAAEHIHLTFCLKWWRRVS